MLREGWYLMSPADVEAELARTRGEERDSNARPLSVEEALAYRDSGNVPDELGRTLRIVLRIEASSDAAEIAASRLRYEPDFHEAPRWRRDGSRPVTIFPLIDGSVTKRDGPRAWWDEPEIAELEREWQETGRAAGIAVPADYRGFVYKTVVALRRAGRPVSAAAVADSVARWLTPADAEKLRSVLVSDDD